MGSIGAQLTMDFVIHFEQGASLRMGEKRRVGSTGSTHDGGVQLHFYEYDVYCDRTVLVGKVLQTAIMRDMPTDAPDFLKPGGLFSILTMNIHPGLSVEYRGRSIPVQQAQNMAIGQLVDHTSSKKMRLLGRMDVFACLPCCCLIPKLLNPDMLPWNQYDIFDCNHDFSGAPKAKSIERGPAAMKSEAKNVKIASCDRGTDTAAKTRDKDIHALKQLKNSGVLSHAEYISKVNQVNAKYDASTMQRDSTTTCMEHDEMEALARLREQGILSEVEFQHKREIIMKLEGKLSS